jgi:hypothetical protein
MNFVYSQENITTQDDLIISVADLRDIVNSAFLNNRELTVAEISAVLQGVERKNRLPVNTLLVK